MLHFSDDLYLGCVAPFVFFIVAALVTEVSFVQFLIRFDVYWI